jgi:hypothetical protein
MSCAACNGVIPDGSPTCPKCGAPSPVAVSPRRRIPQSVMVLVVVGLIAIGVIYFGVIRSTRQEQACERIHDLCGPPKAGVLTCEAALERAERNSDEAEFADYLSCVDEASSCEQVKECLSQLLGFEIP